MGTHPTLYLAYDGVLHPNLVTFRENGLPRLRAGGHELFENNALLEAIIEACPQTEVVLHCWWVPLLGYRSALAMLPELVRNHVVGATWHSGRGLRARRRPSRPRRAWLDDDLKRRHPAYPVLLDCDLIQVAPMLADCACVVDEWRGLASAGACERLCSLLTAYGSKRPCNQVGGQLPSERRDDSECSMAEWERCGAVWPRASDGREDAFPLRNRKFAC